MIESKALEVIYSVQNIWHCLLGFPFIFHKDHNALKHMINKPQLNGFITQWVLLL